VGIGFPRFRQFLDPDAQSDSGVLVQRDSPTLQLFLHMFPLHIYHVTQPPILNGVEGYHFFLSVITSKKVSIPLIRAIFNSYNFEYFNFVKKWNRFREL